MAEIYPPNMQLRGSTIEEEVDENDSVTLYDVLYACITTEVFNGK